LQKEKDMYKYFCK